MTKNTHAGPGPNEQRLIKLDGHTLRKHWHDVLKPAILEFLEELKELPEQDDVLDEELLETAAALEAVDEDLQRIAASRDELAEAFKARAQALGLKDGRPVKACGYIATFSRREGTVDWKALSKEQGILPSVIESYRKAPVEYVSLNKARKKK